MKPWPLTLNHHSRSKTLMETFKTIILSFLLSAVTLKRATGIPYTHVLFAGTKAGQTEFTVYRHRPHGFSDFPPNFQIQYNIQYLGPHPLQRSN